MNLTIALSPQRCPRCGITCIARSASTVLRMPAITVCRKCGWWERQRLLSKGSAHLALLWRTALCVAGAWVASILILGAATPVTDKVGPMPTLPAHTYHGSQYPWCGTGVTGICLVSPQPR